MKPLWDESADPLTRSLLEAGRDLPVNQDAKARLLAAAGGAALATAVGAQVGRYARWKLLAGSQVTKLSVALLVAGGGGAYLVTRPEAPPAQVAAPQTSRVAAAAPKGAEPRAAEPASASPVMEEAVPSEAAAALPTPSPNEAPQTKLTASRPRGATPARSEVSPVVGVGAQLAREVALVEELRTAVRAGQRDRAEQLFAKYREQFHTGQLQPEVAKLASVWARQSGSKGAP